MCSKSSFYDFYNFLRISNHEFSKANLGYLNTFLRGMLESKLALNNLNFKCYFQFFFVRARIGQKKWGVEFLTPPPGKSRLAKSLWELGLKYLYMYRKVLLSFFDNGKVDFYFTLIDV